MKTLDYNRPNLPKSRREDSLFHSFRPAWWCPGPHLQTVWRKFFGRTAAVAVRRERWETADEDFLDIDWADPPSGPDPETATVLFLHGLEGSSRAKYILGMLEAIRPLGWRGVAVNFRSCSGEMNRRLPSYHSGETGDLDAVVRKLIQLFPRSPLIPVGFSLGGNVLLKWLGEQGEKVPPQVSGAAAISVPFDLEAAARSIDRGFSRVYGRAFLKTLKQKAIFKAKQHPGRIDADRVARIRSFAEFDDLVTAPVHGFKNGLDYWRRSSSKNFLGEIRVPTLLVSAEDDPFLPGRHLPKGAVRDSKWLFGEFPRTGGHVGFVEGPAPWSARYWHEPRIFNFLRRLIERG